MVSRMREGSRKEELLAKGQVPSGPSLAIDWKEALYLATWGGSATLDVQAGIIAEGQSFDMQLST